MRRHVAQLILSTQEHQAPGIHVIVYATLLASADAWRTDFASEILDVIPDLDLVFLSRLHHISAAQRRVHAELPIAKSTENARMPVRSAFTTVNATSQEHCP